MVDELLEGGPGPVVAVEAGVGRQAAIDAVRRAADALLPQVSHEELQADEREHAQAEHGEDHHVGQLLHRLDQGAHDGLQACRTAGGRGVQTGLVTTLGLIVTSH